MNKTAAAKAVGMYLLIAGGIALWFGMVIWSFVTGQSNDIRGLAIIAPALVFLAAMALMLVIWLPIASLYDHYVKGAAE